MSATSETAKPQILTIVLLSLLTTIAMAVCGYSVRVADGARRSVTAHQIQLIASIAALDEWKTSVNARFDRIERTMDKGFSDLERKIEQLRENG